MNLYQKILTVYKEVRSIVKDGEIEQGNSSYLVVTHDAVTRALHMPLANAGIVCIPNLEICQNSDFEVSKVWNKETTVSKWYRADVKASITFVNADDPTDRFTSHSFAYAFDKSDKAIGKAYSMAIKNIYLKVFMLESVDHEEERELEKFDKPDYKKQVNTVQAKAEEIKKTVVETVKPPMYIPKNEAPADMGLFRKLVEKMELLKVTSEDVKTISLKRWNIVDSKLLKVYQAEYIIDNLSKAKDREEFLKLCNEVK